MIKRVIANDFMSWKKLEFTIEDGVTLIDGWNEDDQTPEGSGKSAILNAISWCYFGAIPKEANVDDVIKEGSKSCMVTVISEDGTAVTRSRGPNHLFIIKDFNFQNKIKGKDARETQQMIEELIGLTFETFCQTVYFAQNYTKKFITANQEEKGKILSEVQNLGIFDRARKEVQGLAKVEEEGALKLKHAIDLLRKDEQLVDRDLANEHAVIEMRRQEKQRLVADVDRQIQVANDKMVFQAQQVEALQAQQQSNVVELEQLHLLQRDVAELRMHANEVQRDLSAIDETLRTRAQKESMGLKYGQRYKKLEADRTRLFQFIENPTKNCPTCGTQLEKCDTTHAQQEVIDIEKDMCDLMGMMEDLSVELGQPAPVKDQLQTQLNGFGTQIRELNLLIDQFNAQQRLHTEATAKLAQLKIDVMNNQKSLSDLTNRRTQIEQTEVQVDQTRLTQLKEREDKILFDISTTMALLDNKLGYINKLEKLKDSFKEIKPQIFNSLLNEINAKVNQYLVDLFTVPANIRFVNNDMKIETEIMLAGVPRKLGLLSGGQFRRFSLATDLALSDVISGRKNSKFGVLILDEYFKDLSENSMEKCLALLQKRNKPVLLIEHNSVFKSIVDNSFFVTLRQGTSYASADN